MADEKTGSDGSNETPVVPPAGVSPIGDTPAHVPDKPPVANVMPPTPPLSLDLNAAKKPNYKDLVASTKLKPKTPSTETGVVNPLASAPVDSPAPQAAPAPAAHAVPPPVVPAPTRVPPPVVPAPAKDTVADDVGLVRPPVKIPDAPSSLDKDMSAILASIKLPEKRDFKAAADAPAPKPAAAPPTASLDDVLAARITETAVAPQQTQDTRPPETLAPDVSGQVVPDQHVFHDETTIAPVHTLKQDLQDVVRDQKMSVVRAVALEQEKKRPDPIDTELRPPSRVPAILLSVALLVALGLAALYGVYYVASLQDAPPPPVSTDSIVFAEQTVAFQLTQDSPQSIKTSLAQARLAGGTLGSILNVIPVVSEISTDGVTAQRPATLEEFFRAIGATPPENLLRALDGGFFFGIHTVDKNAPFLVIEVGSYDRAFDGMLSWENRLNGDLQPIFIAVPRLITGADGIPVERSFDDMVLRNYDVRALKDDTGAIQMYYSFPTRDILVIAESPYTFTEILSRLQAGRRL